jgi:hypothetical protein
MAVAPAFPLMMSLSASNIAGFTKKSTVMAMIFLGYCAGNLSGPQFFISTEAPSYHVSPAAQSHRSTSLTLPDCIHDHPSLLRYHHCSRRRHAILSRLGE